MISKQEETRKKILQKYMENQQRPLKLIAKDVGVHPKTVSRAIKQFFDIRAIERKTGSGKKSGPHDKKLEKKVVSTILKHRGMSVRDMAAKCNTNHNMIQRVKKRNSLK